MLKLTLSVHRFTPGTQEKARFETHAVSVSERASMLDALFALQRTATPDLAFRYSCRVGMCGSCAMVVNGREQLTCSTLAQEAAPHLKIEPLRNLPVVRDLAVDFAPFFSAYRKSQPHFTPRADLAQEKFYPLPHDGPEWRGLNHQPQCIDCGACYSACTLVTLNPRYIGPMALHRALTVIVDPRDGRRNERLQQVTCEDGAFRCHTLGNCRDVCPRGISPTQSIQRLKRLAVFVGRLSRRRRSFVPKTLRIPAVRKRTPYGSPVVGRLSCRRRISTRAARRCVRRLPGWRWRRGWGHSARAARPRRGRS